MSTRIDSATASPRATSLEDPSSVPASTTASAPPSAEPASVAPPASSTGGAASERAFALDLKRNTSCPVSESYLSGVLAPEDLEKLRSQAGSAPLGVPTAFQVPDSNLTITSVRSNEGIQYYYPALGGARIPDAEAPPASDLSLTRSWLSDHVTVQGSASLELAGPGASLSIGSDGDAKLQSGSAAIGIGADPTIGFAAGPASIEYSPRTEELRIKQGDNTLTLQRGEYDIEIKGIPGPMGMALTPDGEVKIPAQVAVHAGPLQLSGGVEVRVDLGTASGGGSSEPPAIPGFDWSRQVIEALNRPK